MTQEGQVQSQPSGSSSFLAPHHTTISMGDARALLISWHLTVPSSYLVSPVFTLAKLMKECPSNCSASLVDWAKLMEKGNNRCSFLPPWHAVLEGMVPLCSLENNQINPERKRSQKKKKKEISNQSSPHANQGHCCFRTWPSLTVQGGCFPKIGQERGKAETLPLEWTSQALLPCPSDSVSDRSEVRAFFGI